MAVDRGFYYPAGSSGQGGILVTKCPYDGCIFVLYSLVCPETKDSGLLRDGILGIVLMDLYKSHPLHFCTECMNTHTSDGCIVNRENEVTCHSQPNTPTSIT